MKKLFILSILATAIILCSCQKEKAGKDVIGAETSMDNIDVSKLNPEAKRYYGNMAKFLSLTTSNLKSAHVNRLKSASNENPDSLLNPIVEEFANLDITDNSNNQISFFDLDTTDRSTFAEQWSIAGAADMTPKLEDTIIGKELEEYVKIQNDAFDEVMTQLGGDSTTTLKSAVAQMTTNDLFERISNNVQLRIKEKSEAYAKQLLKSKPELSNKLKSTTSAPDYVNPTSVLNQLREHADRGDILFNLPGSVWLSAYLFYFNPLAISQYVGVGTYPPGHVSIIRQSRSNIPNSISLDGVTISSQNGSGVRLENVEQHWNCKAHLCYVKKRVWKWCCRFVTVHPNADNVIAYAESQIGKPYCSGWDFITAKNRTSCFICTTITWRSFDREGYNIHRLLARWMPTIAPSDLYLSDHVVEKRFIK